MATESISSIRASGGDYTSVSGWIAGEVAITPNLVTADIILVGELYNDWAGNGLNDSTNFGGTGFTVDATRYILLRAPAAGGNGTQGPNKHDGTWNSGPRIYKNLAGNGVLYCVINLGIDGPVVVDGIQVYNTSTDDGYNYTCAIRSYRGMTARNCMGRTDMTYTGENGKGVFWFEYDHGLAKNCIAVNSPYQAYGFCSGVYGTGGKYYHCSTYNAGKVGGFYSFSSGYAYACSAWGTFTGNSFAGSWSGADYNADNGDESAPGTNPKSLTEDPFTDSANGDFTYPSDSELVDAAGSTGFGVSTDCIGTARPQNTNYDIGWFEYAAGGTTTAPTTLPSTTLAPTTVITTPTPTTIVTTLAPTTVVTTSQPITVAPTTIITTPVPTTLAPTTIVTTLAPTTVITTLPPTTLAPTTIITTVAPTTIVTTLAPTTIVTTPIPTTLAPTTVVTTLPPTTISPTTVVTTLAPTTVITTLPPTSLAPTTIVTTSAPTTLAPTTVITTLAPTTVITTLAPTTVITTPSPATIVTTLAPTTVIPCWADDNFTGNNGDPPDPSKWIQSAGSPDIQNNSLELTGNNVVSELVTHVATLSGDFDVQVDFSLISYPNTNTWAADLAIIIDATHLMYIGRRYQSFQQQYRRGYRNGGGYLEVSAATSDTSGKLRITRSGSTFRTYYWNGSSWTELSTAFIINSNDAHLVLVANSWSPFPTVTWRADNFTFNSGCPAEVTTAAPTTIVTTIAPTTVFVTSAPTTVITTIPPATLAPTTIITTLAPTTVAATLLPTTAAPTVAPVTFLTTLAPTTALIPIVTCTKELNSVINTPLLLNSVITKEFKINGNLCW